MERLRELRKEKKLTLRQLSDELAKMNFKISADSLGKYERGERNPKLDKAIEIATYFHVPVSYLLGTSDDRKYFSNNDDPRLMLEQFQLNPLNEFKELYMNPSNFDGSVPDVDLSNDERFSVVRLENDFRDILVGLQIPYIYDEPENAQLRMLQKKYLKELYKMVALLDRMATEPLRLIKQEDSDQPPSNKSKIKSLGKLINTIKEINKTIQDNTD